MSGARMIGLLALVAGCGGEGALGDDLWVPVQKGDLALDVDVVGSLVATRSAPVGPPSGLDQDDFKIARMAPEGSSVEAGTKVLFFDDGELETELLGRVAERDSAAKEIERKLQELELSKREGELRVTEAEALARKAALKADLPAKYTAAIEVKLAQIDLHAAEAELKMARQRTEHSLRLGRAELAYLRDRHARFAGRTARLQELMDRLSVAAPIDGVVVYRSNWRGEKKKVGDDCEVGEPCVEITDTKRDAGHRRGGRDGVLPGGGRADGAAAPGGAARAGVGGQGRVAAAQRLPPVAAQPAEGGGAVRSSSTRPTARACARGCSSAAGWRPSGCAG